MKRILMFSLGIICMIALMSFTFPNKKKKKVAAPPAMQHIPSGVLYEMTEEGKEETSIDEFFMMEIEVTNSFYREFLADLGKNGKVDDLKIAKVQNEKWNAQLSYNEPFVETYHKHPAYDDYPVVTVTKEAAELYCKWLTQKWKENPNKPKNLIDKEIEYRLPTKQEWMYAARGGNNLAPFPWGGYYLRNAKGCVLANYKIVNEARIKYNHNTNEYEVIGNSNSDMIPMSGQFQLSDASMTAPSRTYFPNNFGLYNMSGNVSEMLSDGGTKGGSYGSTGYFIQIEAEEEFPELNGEASRFVGFRPVAVIK